MTKKKLMIDPARSLLVAPGRRLQVRLRQGGAAEAKTKIHGDVYVLGKDFLVNLADGHYAKLGVAIVVDHGAAMPAGGRRPRRGRAQAARGLRPAAPGGRGARHRHRHPHRRRGRTSSRTAAAATSSRSGSSSASSRAPTCRSMKCCSPTCPCSRRQAR